ncbi:MAG: hypothetical protein N2C12_10855 [Planctomycetales bacterium]
MPQFVILRHQTLPGDTRHSHWDLMFEQSNCLKTWSLPTEPAAGVVVQAEELPDHRIDFLEFEGELSGNRGTVTRWDRGSYETISSAPGRLVYELTGKILSTRVSIRTSGKTIVEITFGPIKGARNAL